MITERFSKSSNKYMKLFDDKKPSNKSSIWMQIIYMVVR